LEEEMSFKAKHINLTAAGFDIYFSWVNEVDNIYHSVDLNIDQVVLLMKQAAEIISRCSIVRPIP
jgi:hypothetical protein